MTLVVSVSTKQSPQFCTNVFRRKISPTSCRPINSHNGGTFVLNMILSSFMISSVVLRLTFASRSTPPGVRDGLCTFYQCELELRSSILKIVVRCVCTERQGLRTDENKYYSVPCFRSLGLVIASCHCSVSRSSGCTSLLPPFSCSSPA